MMSSSLLGKRPPPKTKEEERKLHTSQLSYSMNFDIMWALAGYLMTLRAPRDSVFYISASESIVIAFMQRMVFCLHFRWKRRREVRAIDVEVDAVKLQKVEVLAVEDVGDIEVAAELVSTTADTAKAELDSTALATNEIPSTDEPSQPFTPLDPVPRFGHHTLGTMASECISKICAFIILILFVTLPDASAWSSYCGTVTTVQASTRLASLLAGGLVVDTAAAAIESQLLGLDYADAVAHFRVARLGFKDFAFVFSSGIMAVVGYYILADGGVVVLTPTYQRGRKF
ncbi:hypothetical protein HK101_007992 [Irineochytrium annulatum]|nr:hypothetical protein HK101_007992 [Irineochytrium annulatum]